MQHMSANAAILITPTLRSSGAAHGDPRLAIEYEGMRRRALRPSFVVTFAVGAAAFAGGCSSSTKGTPAVCEPGSTAPCNPPFVLDAGPDVHDGGPDGEGPDGGHVVDAAGDVAPDADSE